MTGFFIVSINLGNTLYVDQKNEIIQIAESRGESLTEPADSENLKDVVHLDSFNYDQGFNLDEVYD